jgi:hypothetical protein
MNDDLTQHLVVAGICSVEPFSDGEDNVCDLVSFGRS